MPKMKTKSSAKKRFRVRPGGTVKRGQAFKRHILTKKTTKNKRHLRGAVTVHETNMGHMAQMLPFAWAFDQRRTRSTHMPRVKRGVTARARHKKVLALAKGFRGRRGNVFRIAKQAVMKAGQYAYRDRRTRKRVFRQLWIARINAGARELRPDLQPVHANGLKKARSRSTARSWPTGRARPGAFGSIVEQGQGQAGRLTTAGLPAAAHSRRSKGLRA
jgi:large subunit ribosomal protein L20